MTILLYDYCDLEERTSSHLKVWKAWHLVLYALAAVFGIANYVFLRNTMELVDNNCVLFPRELEFRMIELPEGVATRYDVNGSVPFNERSSMDNGTNVTDNAQVNNTVQFDDLTEKAKITAKSEGNDNTTMTSSETTIFNGNSSIMIGNTTHRLVLDTSRTLFETDNDCQFAEYMPILSTVFAAVWITLFTMCPGGGHARTGLQQPWRILAPSLLFALVMVGLTGHSFTTTNSGLHAFCEAFFEVTNSTTCSSVNMFVERGWNASWGMGGRAGATRAASAAVWASWACAAALLLARCLAAPDFQVKRTGAYLIKDPQQKITPHLKKSRRPSQRSANSSPTKRDNMSVRSEPTITTELVTVEHEEDSAPSSLMATPAKTQRNADMIEMTYTAQERLGER